MTVTLCVHFVSDDPEYFSDYRRFKLDPSLCKHVILVKQPCFIPNSIRSEFSQLIFNLELNMSQNLYALIGPFLECKS